MLFTREFFDFVKDGHVDDLADQEGNQAADDDPHSLSEYCAEGRLHIRNTVVLIEERPDCPKSVKENDLKPKVGPREKIFPPIHSAINAFATKKAVKNRKSLVGLSSRIFRIILL